MLPVDERGRATEARLKDRYTFEGFLGQGGFAAVYRVRNLRLDRAEALKVLFESRGSDPKFAARFEREARVAASLEHANIVRVYDFGNAEGTLWYSMQYVDGPTLKTRLERHGRMLGEEAAALLMPLLEALDVVHRGGIVHRDVKPDNIILDADERPYLMDFGIVKRDDNVQETLEGKILGTPGYLSPEQLRGHPLDGRSDLYAAGITLYQMLTGDIPFRSDDRIATMTRRLTEDPEPPSAKVPDLPPELEGIVLKALARERDDRFANAGEMRAALETFLVAQGASARSRSGALPRVGSGPHLAVPEEDTGSGTSVLTPAPAAIPPSTPPAPSPVAARPASSAATRFSAWLPAAVALVLAVVGLTALLITRRAERSSSTPNAAVSLATAAQKTAPSPLASASPVAAPAANPSPERVVPTIPVEKPTASVASLPLNDPIVSPRVPRVPADVLEEAPIVLAPSLAAACEGKTVGVTLTVARDGSLKSSHVVSKATPECDAAALDLLTRYRFRAERDEHDRPVEGRLTLSVRF